eukprot:46583_1
MNVHNSGETKRLKFQLLEGNHEKASECVSIDTFKLDLKKLYGEREAIVLIVVKMGNDGILVSDVKLKNDETIKAKYTSHSKWNNEVTFETTDEEKPKDYSVFLDKKIKL